MKFLLMEIIAGILLVGLCVAQDTATPNNSTPQTQQNPASGNPDQQTPQDDRKQVEPQDHPRAIAPGSVIPVQLSKTVDAKKVKVGDEVDAKVTQDMKSASGEILVAKDAKVIGHVTEVQARSKDQKESEVGIAFDGAVMKDGSVSSVPMSIQAVVAPRNPNAENESAGGSASPSSESTNNPGRSPMAGRPPLQAPSEMPGAQSGSNTNAEANDRPPITANTQGIVGIPNYELSTQGDPSRGSVVHSEKSNVKLESGTLLLLRVNQ